MKLFIVLVSCVLLACAVQGKALSGVEESLLPALSKVKEVAGKVASNVENVANNAKDEAHALLEKIKSQLHLPDLKSKDAQLAIAALKVVAVVAGNALRYG